MAPYVFSAQDCTFLLDGKKCNFPEAPPFAKYIVAWFIAPWYGELWRFAPCDMFGRPLGAGVARGEGSERWVVVGKGGGGHMKVLLGMLLLLLCLGVWCGCVTEKYEGTWQGM